MTMISTHKKALIYCRVSTKKQELEGGGLGSQEKRCREFASSRDYTVDAVFHDSYSGAGDFMKRPAMRQLLEYVDSNPQSYIVIFDDLKRFARDLKFHWELRAEFQTRNLTPECLNFTFEETPEGAFIETIIAAQGELERQQNKRQVIQKMQARLQRGIYCLGGKAPFGYNYVKNPLYGGKFLQIADEDAVVLKTAFEHFSLGTLFHITDVAKYINQYLQQKDRQIRKQDTIKAILTNPVYAGFVEYKKWDVPRLQGLHEPIISLELFEKVQERLFGKLPQRTRKDIRIDFPLRGFVCCAYCNSHLTASWSTGKLGKKHPYYRCTNKDCAFRNRSIPRNEIHFRFEYLLKGITFKNEFLNTLKLKLLNEYIQETKKADQKMQAFKHKVTAITEQVSLLIGHITSNPSNSLIGVYEQEIAKLEMKKAVLQEKCKRITSTVEEDLEHLLDKAFSILNKLYIIWIKGGYDEKITVQKLLLNENIKYSRKEGFGTPEKCYVLRFLQNIQANSDQNLPYVNLEDFNWNTLIDGLRYINDLFEPKPKKEKTVVEMILNI